MDSNIKSKDLPYRPCVGIMLLNAENKVWVGKRFDSGKEYEFAWQMPQGGIDKGEEPLTAAFREMEEETGTAKAELISALPGWLTYDLPDHLVGLVWKGKYRGQKQKWFVFRFTGTDDDINIKTRHPEFSEWRWANMQELTELVVPFKKELYQQIVKNFYQLHV